MALATLKELGLPHGYRSKSWDEFAGPQAPEMDQIVIGRVRGEVCPVWPGHPAVNIGRFPIRPNIRAARRCGRISAVCDDQKTSRRISATRK